MKNYTLIGTIHYGEGVDEPWSEIIWASFQASNRADAMQKANLVIAEKIKEARKNPSFKSLEVGLHTPPFATIRRVKS
ncbi:MAG: hypothetical protein WC629_01930 [Candidatus Paceibacterota bacterium]|jgi:hypothetical protein